MQDRTRTPSDIADGPLPSGRHSLTRDAVLASQRGRLLDAMAEAVAEHGYGATTIAHVVSRAGVSRKTFYEHFTDKEQCFLALYDAGIAYVLGRLAEVLEPRPTRDRAGRGTSRVPHGAPRRARLLPGDRARDLRRRADRRSQRRRCCRCSPTATWRSTGRRASSIRRSAPLTDDIALGVVGAILESSPARSRRAASRSCPALSRRALGLRAP